jgi:hypothetical protein
MRNVRRRDREDEPRRGPRCPATCRRLRPCTLEEPTAVVFHRPLPYLYLAQRVFADAHVPYQAFDALPLAAQPYAALLDVVLTAARTGVTRGAAVELMRSGLLVLSVEGVPVSGRDVAALDEVLAARRSVGEADTSPLKSAESVSGATPEHERRMFRERPRPQSTRRSLSGFRDGPSASAGAVDSRFPEKHERVGTGIPGASATSALVRTCSKDGTRIRVATMHRGRTKTSRR